MNRIGQAPCISRCNLLLYGRRRTAAFLDNPAAQGRTIPSRGAANTEIPQDSKTVTTRVDMTKAKLPGVRHRQVQLVAQILQAFRAEIVLTGRKTPMCPEEPELKGNPDPAVGIEASTNSISSKFRRQHSRKDRSDIHTSPKQR